MNKLVYILLSISIVCNIALFGFGFYLYDTVENLKVIVTLNDKIIEIGAIKVINNEIVEEFNHMINPNLSLPEIIVNITGITNNDLKDKESIELILPKFIEFIGDLPLLAHNNSFDLSFINDLFRVNFIYW